MPAFSYEALHPAGHTVTGTLDADSAKSARAQLRTQGLAVVQVREVTTAAAPPPTPADPYAAGPHTDPATATNGAPSPSQAFISTLTALWQPRPALSPAQLAVWTRQLAALTHAGLTIERALHHLADEASTPQHTALMADLLTQVKAGHPFSQALRSHPRVFSGVYCAVIAAGERSGSLSTVLGSLADDLEAAQELRAKVLGAALYPAIVSAIAVLIVGFLMVYVLPQVAGAFTSSRRSLPLLTTAMLGISAFVRDWWPALLGTVFTAWIALQIAWRRPASATRLHAAVLNLPLLGPLVRHYNAARFASTLGMLTTAGVPILGALQAAAHTVGNRAMRTDLDDVARLVREGAPLGLALAHKSRFPRLVGTFARLGAETGNAGAMLTRAGQQLAAEVQRRALHLAGVLEPLLILCMGVVVLLIVLAVLMPIIELNSFVR